MTVRFEVETVIDAPLDRVFDLSLAIDAHRASMSASNERAIGGVTRAASVSASTSPGERPPSASPPR